VLAYMAADDGEGGGRAELLPHLKAYCCERSLAKKREFYEQMVQGKPARERFDDAVFERLSPAGHLEQLSTRVILLHDPSDDLIPPEHSMRNYQELAARTQGGGQELLVTSLLSHVNRGSMPSLRDLFRFIALAGEIFD
jgi:hypothetical protein